MPAWRGAVSSRHASIDPRVSMKLASLEAIAVALRDAGARYLIVGGLAVAAHGYGRVTFDLDLVVQLQPDNLRRAMQALESLGYRPTLPVQTRQFADAESRDAWIRDKNMVVFQMHSDKHPETRIDLFVSEPFDFDSEYDAALVGEILPGLPVRFVCLETLVQMKAMAGRPKDLEDVRQLRLLQQEPDHGE
ncbi:MAG: nucleotidyltransferase family protein [Gammaproteobacteria bacterium]|nr:nucleotidyltransferase family protein [Gammaproteobacteria bacterium]